MISLRFLTFVAGLGWLGSGIAGAATATPGEPAPEWTLTNVEGDPVRLSDFAGRVVLLNFFRTTCAPCLWEIPDLMSLQEQYGAQGLTVIGISAQESAETLRSYSAAQDVNYPICLSTDAVLWDYHVFPLAAIPLTVLIDRDGVVVDWYRYYQKRSFHEAKLLPLLGAGSAPELAIGWVDGALEISWPAAAAEFILESRPSYDPASGWRPAFETIEEIGDRRRILRSPAGGAVFYRLRRP